SMSDPSLRRLLDASRNSHIPPHWQIQKRHEIRDNEMKAAMEEVQRRAKAYAELLGRPGQLSRPAQLEDSVRAALGQDETHGLRVCKSMGVKTIWVDQFDQIPDVIAAIDR